MSFRTNGFGLDVSDLEVACGEGGGKIYRKAGGLDISRLRDRNISLSSLSQWKSAKSVLNLLKSFQLLSMLYPS